MSVSKPKCQHTDQTNKEKIEILGKSDCGVKAVDLCKQFNLSQSMLSTWKKQRPKLNEMVDAGKDLNTKQNRESFLPQVERALHLWFHEMRSKPHASLINQSPITGMPPDLPFRWRLVIAASFSILCD